MTPRVIKHRRGYCIFLHIGHGTLYRNEYISQHPYTHQVMQVCISVIPGVIDTTKTKQRSTLWLHTWSCQSNRKLQLPDPCVWAERNRQLEFSNMVCCFGLMYSNKLFSSHKISCGYISIALSLFAPVLVTACFCYCYAKRIQYDRYFTLHSTYTRNLHHNRSINVIHYNTLVCMIYADGF